MHTLSSVPGAAADADGVLELRQYRLHPGGREPLLRLFERHFIEPQEALGARVRGHFRDLDDADRFGWLRGFSDMAARLQALQSFYGGPVWAEHRDAANATMVDSDDVRLLRPAWPGAGIDAAALTPAPLGVDSTMSAPGLLELLVLPLESPADPLLLRQLRHELQPALARAGALQQGCYLTEPARNDYPRLPVREGEPVLVVMALWPGPAPAAQGLFEQATPIVDRPGLGLPERRRWQPCAHSALHAGPTRA